MSYPPQPKPYAETHFLFPVLPVSRYRRSFPEIIADSPRRVEPGHHLPVLIIVKDAHRWQITLNSVIIRWCDRSLPPMEFPINEQIDRPYWSYLLSIPTESLPKKQLDFDVIIKASRNNQDHIITNHNYVGISPKPLTVNISQHPFPKPSGWVVGDLHVHTRYTDDQVEFGAPVTATALIAQAQGLDFYAATDHSYNLDDTWTNPLKNDPNLPKYKALNTEIEHWNRDRGGTLTVIPGEEVSSGNQRDRNLHLLVLGPGNFIPGKGDSAEAWLPKPPDLSTQHIVSTLNDQRVALAAHPEVDFPYLERLLLGRGCWEPADFRHQNLTGIQIVRGHDSIPFRHGVNLWIRLLLQGLRLTLTAGSDAHGDFNRYIYVRTPMLTLGQRSHPVFGEALTLLPAPDSVDVPSLISQIRYGTTGITNGPGIGLTFRDNHGTWYSIGNDVPQRDGTAALNIITTPEFGPIDSIWLWAGNRKLHAEELAWFHQPSSNTYQFEREIPIRMHKHWNYLRAEVHTKGEREIGRALTGAIYFL